MPPAASAASSHPDAEPVYDPTEARTFGWLGIALGAEGAVVATATSVAILDYKSTRDSGCNADRLCSAAALSANSQIGSLVGWNAGAWVLAASGLGVGSFLLLTNPPAKEGRTSITLAPSGTMAGLGLSGSF
jgi:hypothetical protein